MITVCFGEMTVVVCFDQRAMWVRYPIGSKGQNDE
jgi:hypothetical protein